MQITGINYFYYQATVHTLSDLSIILNWNLSLFTNLQKYSYTLLCQEKKIYIQFIFLDA